MKRTVHYNFFSFLGYPGPHRGDLENITREKAVPTKSRGWRLSMLFFFYNTADFK